MASLVEQIRIVPFAPADQAAVRELILDGLREHWGAIDPDRNADLVKIAESYASGVFLVAWQGDRVVGTGALVPVDADTAEIKRMSVARDQRRQGVGRAILGELLARAHAASFRRVILETTSTWQEAVDFYLSNGFRITHQRDGDTFFVRELVS
ncbi:MAG: GNAT family N-acetyltransferase [Planctomycetaceae bacterium]